jgi:hypothetical protein
MATALTDAGRQPVSEICPWRTAMKRRAVTDEPPKPFPKPSIASPVVYHLHGSLADIDSMVLTEDDYLDFLVAMSSVPDLVPPQIERAFSTSLLFLGYSLEDMNFKVLFRKLESFMSRTAGAVHVSVQLEPGKDRAPGTPLSKEEAASLVAQRNFLQKRLGLQRVAVYWGTCNDFAKDLGERWRQMSQ